MKTTNPATLQTFKAFATKTRAVARAITKHLKENGFDTTAPTVKAGKGWLVTTHKTIKTPKRKQVFNVINNRVVEV